VGHIVPGHDLREGDPLSPYLFIICAEVLSSLIREAERRNDIRSTMVCIDAPVISHLLFADDCFLFFRACEREVVFIKIFWLLMKKLRGRPLISRSRNYFVVVILQMI